MPRKANPQPGSYTTKLFEGGHDKILKKVAEEAGEVLIAAKGRKRDRDRLRDGRSVFSHPHGLGIP